jgi:hypothetical protein
VKLALLLAAAVLTLINRESTEYVFPILLTVPICTNCAPIIFPSSVAVFSFTIPDN